MNNFLIPHPDGTVRLEPKPPGVVIEMQFCSSSVHVIGQEFVRKLTEPLYNHLYCFRRMDGDIPVYVKVSDGGGFQA